MRLAALVDVAMAAALLATGALEIVTNNLVEGADPRVVVTSLLVGAVALLARSRWPLVCLGVLVCLVSVIGPAITAPLVVALLLAFATVGRRCSDQWAITAAGIGTAVLIAQAALGPVPSDAVIFM